MGAKIHGAGTDKITINGVKRLRGTSYEVLPDRIESGTYLVAGAITRGHVRIKNTRPDHLDAVLAKLQEAGAEVGVGDNWVEVDMRGRALKAVVVRRHRIRPPTDMQAQFAALNTVAAGVDVTETILKSLRTCWRCGAWALDPSRGQHGRSFTAWKLTAAVMATDLRASASLVPPVSSPGRTDVERIYPARYG
jgi:UDP-N-acetylglucosamine 1-carboxyvinyltransferase